MVGEAADAARMIAALRMTTTKWNFNPSFRRKVCTYVWYILIVDRKQISFSTTIKHVSFIVQIFI